MLIDTVTLVENYHRWPLATRLRESADGGSAVTVFDHSCRLRQLCLCHSPFRVVLYYR
jgi:hypothetical protein